MTPYRLRSVQFIPVPLAEAWDFFADPRNLPRLTPPWLSIELLADPPERMYPGMLIEYRVRPLWGIPLRWLTEITHVVEPLLFVDEQRFGPYRLWHHLHRFRAFNGGVEMEDEVHYLLRGGPLGRVAQRYLVRSRLEEIFDYRRAEVERIFGGG